MNKKILAFVFDDKKFLALRNNSKDPAHGGNYWFTVTGSIKKSETLEEAVAREIKEETNLNVKEVFDLNWGSIYNWNNQNHEERNFVVFIQKGNIKLSKEHVEYRWLNVDGFVKLIRWDDNKELLKNALKKALKKERYFKKLEIKDYR